MRNVLSLLLVLCLAVAANAALVVTINGIPWDQHPPIVLEPSDVIELDLELTGGDFCNGYTVDFIIDNQQAEWITDGRLPGTAHIAFPEDGFDFDGKVAVPPSAAQLTRVTAGNLFSGPVAGPVLMKDLYLHCLEDTDVIVEVVIGGTTQVGPTGEVVDIPIGTVLATIPIIQIPEPITVALLGLGGLFLRRRK
jgi:hypothetical protein